MHSKWVQATTYIGASVSIIIFSFFGLLSPSFPGGTIGPHIAGKIFGRPLAQELFPKIIVAASIAFGVLLFTVAIISLFAALGGIAGFCLGWLVLVPSLLKLLVPVQKNSIWSFAECP
jgi:hypothetical protein